MYSACFLACCSAPGDLRAALAVRFKAICSTGDILTSGICKSIIGGSAGGAGNVSSSSRSSGSTRSITTTALSKSSKYSSTSSSDKGASSGGIASLGVRSGGRLLGSASSPSSAGIRSPSSKSKGSPLAALSRSVKEVIAEISSSSG